ncbi:hypothetical protein Val02_20920 [Virgisporangium aliadipatigenens]|uniref:Uncharacterized protein n=1 Tax=Virgisporangium aliadipatigenens TaxID=741659 RepID=A0A8J4DPR8_9ACTN|nr:hypothetical protein [Virgisporangium aliadipatigenens]GIJ45206.1 hypothetical protein Val02_20920 [Virgisporangium aliadipatigenens]
MIAVSAPRRREPGVLLAVGLVALAVSAVEAKSTGTWLLEVLAAIVAAVILVRTYRRFPLSPSAYRLILVHALVRRTPLRPGRRLAALTVCVVLAIGAITSLVLLSRVHDRQLDAHGLVGDAGQSGISSGSRASG